MAGENDDDDAGQVAIEKEAREMGWIPKDRYRGPEEDWKPAAEYVARGKEVLPIVRANNRKLLDELQLARQELNTLKGTLTQQQQTTKDLLEHQASEIKRQVESRLSDLRADKKAAIKDGDHDLAAELEEQIDKTKDQLAEANKPRASTPPPPPAPNPIEPWAREFGEANDDWLGKDKRKTALFQGICEDLMATTSLRAAALVNEAKNQMDAMLDKAPSQRMASKAEGGDGGWSSSGGGGGSRTGGSKGYNDLPSDAKEVCNRQEAKFVGPGKAFKTQAEWRTHYAKSVFN